MRLTLDERLQVGFAEGLWRTYSESYTHEDLDGLNVPKTDKNLTEKERTALTRFRKTGKWYG